MFVVELLLPWFIFVPTRWLRVVNGAGQLALQIAIMATGNYNFFNFLTSALAIALLDNSAFDSRLRRQRTSWSRSISNGISVVVLLAVLAGAATFVANRAHWWNFDTLSRHLATLVRTSVLLGWLWLGLSFAQVGRARARGACLIRVCFNRMCGRGIFDAAYRRRAASGRC